MSDLGNGIPQLNQGLGIKDQLSWRAPTPGKLKINIDGAFIKETLSGGWGFIIRDHLGDVVAAGARRLAAVPDVLTTEAEACCKALLSATDLGISHIQTRRIPRALPRKFR